MVRVKKKVIAIVLTIALALSLVSFTACFGRGEGGKQYSQYTINAVWCDDEKTLSVEMELIYRNSYLVELSYLSLHLFPQAFREGAKYAAVTSSYEIQNAFPDGEVNYGTFTLKDVTIGGKAAKYRIEGVDENILTVDFPSPLLPTHTIMIGITYTVRLPNIRHRFGWYGNTVNLGNFFPIAAVFENGEFHQDPYYSWGDPFFSAVAKFCVSITAPKNLIAAMSGLSEREELEGDTAITRAQIKRARDFAIVLGEFAVLEEEVDGILIRYYHTECDEPEKNLQTAVDSIKTFNELFGKYPYKSFSVVQTPFLHGGMEYPGLVMISDMLDGACFREVIIHETAHQWWYAVVGVNQVRHAWIDETLAEFSTTLFFEHNPDYGVTYEQRIASALSAYTLFADLYRHKPNFSTAMCRHLSEFRSAREYVYLTYVKGQIMMDALRAQIGADAVIQGMRYLYEQNKFGIVTPALFTAAFENASQRQLASFFDAWTSGTIQIFANP